MSSRRRAARPAASGVLAALVLTALVASGCDTNDGRALAAPPPGATAPPMQGSTTSTATPVLPPVGSNDTGSLVLSSPAFADGQPIPDRYACTGENVSPPLAWAGVPPGTVELAVTVVDITTPEVPFVHWVATRIDPSVTAIGDGAVPEGAVEARNDSSEFGWFGPCPPAGETHTYVVTLFALTSPSGVADGTGGPEAVQQIAVTPGLAATLTGTFTGP